MKLIFLFFGLLGKKALLTLFDRTQNMAFLVPRVSVDFCRENVCILTSENFTPTFRLPLLKAFFAQELSWYFV